MTMPSNLGTLLCQYHYDPLDRLVDYSPSAQANAQRFYLKDRLVTEIQGAMQCSIMQHEDQLLAQRQHLNGMAETRLLATDQQRSVLNVLDAAHPHPLAYSPYGHRHPGNGLLSLLGFNGERPDPVTGCYLLGNGYRAFNPVLMRFNSPDSWSPFGEGGLNAYMYCTGDPVNSADPTGHIKSFLGKILGHFGTYTPEDNGFLRGAWSTTKQSLRRNSQPTNEPISAAREHVKNAIKNVIDPAPFVQKLEAVNTNLISHGNKNLPMEHAFKYEKLVQQVSSGEMSNTGAHASATSMWAEKYFNDRRPSGVVGVIFNAGGTLVSGAQDHALQKTGKALRQNNN
jgi:RHS repeat-associated protein